MNKLLCLTLLMGSTLLGMEQPRLTFYNPELGGTDEVMLVIPKKHVLTLTSPELLNAWASKHSASAGFLARLDAKTNLRASGAKERLWEFCKEHLESSSYEGYQVLFGCERPDTGNQEHGAQVLLHTGHRLQNYLFELRRGASVKVRTLAGSVLLERKACEKFCNANILAFWRSYSGSNIPSKEWFDKNLKDGLSDRDQEEQVSWLWNELLTLVDDLEDAQARSDIGQKMKRFEDLSIYHRKLHLMTCEGLLVLKDAEEKRDGKRKREY